MGEKEKVEEVTPEVETEPVVETPPEVSIEDLQKQIQERDAKILEQQQTVTKHAERERKLRDQSDVLAAIHKRLDDSEELQATMLDHLEELRGQPVEETPSPPKSHREQLETRRKERGTVKQQTAIDPDVQTFFSYCDAIDLYIDNDSFEKCDPLVKEALGENRGFKEGLKYLKSKVKENKEGEVSKAAEESAKVLLEQKLKEHGLTASDASGPSVASQNDEAFLRSYSEGKSDDHARAAKLLKNLK